MVQIDVTAEKLKNEYDIALNKERKRVKQRLGWRVFQKFCPESSSSAEEDEHADDNLLKWQKRKK